MERVGVEHRQQQRHRAHRLRRRAEPPAQQQHGRPQRPRRHPGQHHGPPHDPQLTPAEQGERDGRDGEQQSAEDQQHVLRAGSAGGGARRDRRRGMHRRGGVRCPGGMRRRGVRPAARDAGRRLPPSPRLRAQRGLQPGAAAQQLRPAGVQPDQLTFEERQFLGGGRRQRCHAPECAEGRAGRTCVPVLTSGAE
ncbi:hypothetical protein ACFQVA_37620 [Actinomadura keratinilytica]